MKKITKTIITSAVMLFTLLPTLTSCGFTYCQHKLETIKGTPANCRETGIKSHYECEFCGQLFGYDRYGIYEIEEPEVDESGTHELMYLPKARGLSNSLDRVEYNAYCKICEKEFDIDNEDIIKFAPGTQVKSSLDNTDNDNVTSTHIVEGNTVGTTYTIKAGTKKGNKTIIWRTGDNNSNLSSEAKKLYDTSIPYAGGTTTDAMIMIRNESDKDIKVKYCAEDNGARCYANSVDGTTILVKARSVTPIHLPIKLAASQPGCCHELYMEEDVDIETKLTIWGAFLPATYKSISAISGNFTYKVGERFLTKDLVLQANYLGQAPKNKIISLDECDIPLRGKLLKQSDKLLKITYRGITTELPLTVYDPNDFREFRFAKTPVTDYKVGDVIDYSALSFEATYGEGRTLTAIKVPLSDIEYDKIEGPLTKEHDKMKLVFKYNGKTISFTLNVKEAANNE